MKKKIVFLTGAGMSAESGLSTYRDSNGLWENYRVEEVATHNAWLLNSSNVNKFYNMLRVKYKDAQPNMGHKLIAELENEYDVTVITQNVDNLHEQAGSTNVIHLHGNALIMCSEQDVENTAYHVQLPHEGWGEYGLEVPEGTLAGDGSLLRPYIVFFGEDVPNLTKAASEVASADIFVIIGTSLEVYPAAGLMYDTQPNIPIYLIDPGTPKTLANVNHIKEPVSTGMKTFKKMIKSL